MRRTSTLANGGRNRRLALALATFGLAIFIGLGWRALLAQESVATPPAGDTGQVHNHTGRPTHLYDGTCADFGEVRIPLNPVGAGTMSAATATDAAAMAVGEWVGATTAVPLEAAATTLPNQIANLTAQPLAIVVQSSEGAYGDWVACGEVGGALANGLLAFGLEPLADSGFAGFALLRETDAGTTVEVYLKSPPAATAGG